MIRKLSIITFTIMVLIGLTAAVSVAASVSSSTIPDELIARKLKIHDPSLAISPEAVIYKIKRNQRLTLVDVRRQQDFERLHIPGSINVPLHAVKTKTYLKSASVALINEGFRYAELENECRRLAEQGFKVSILDGGLPAWKRKGGQLSGDLFALDEMKAVSAQAFFREKDYENAIVVDISPQHSETSRQLVPYALHLPLIDDPDGSIPALKKRMTQNKPFTSLVIFNEAGENYEKAAKMMNRLGMEYFYLQGGVAAYRQYLQGLMLSWKPRDSRIKTIGNCKPCGEKINDDAAGSEVVRPE